MLCYILFGGTTRLPQDAAASLCNHYIVLFCLYWIISSSSSSSTPVFILYHVLKTSRPRQQLTPWNMRKHQDKYPSAINICATWLCRFGLCWSIIFCSRSTINSLGWQILYEYTSSHIVLSQIFHNCFFPSCSYRLLNHV